MTDYRQANDEEREFLYWLVSQAGGHNDFNDSDEVMGWDGWEIDENDDGELLLKVTFQPDPGADTGELPDDRPDAPVIAYWRLVPVDGTGES